MPRWWITTRVYFDAPRLASGAACANSMMRWQIFLTGAPRDRYKRTPENCGAAIDRMPLDVAAAMRRTNKVSLHFHFPALAPVAFSMIHSANSRSEAGWPNDAAAAPSVRPTSLRVWKGILSTRPFELIAATSSPSTASGNKYHTLADRSDAMRCHSLRMPGSVAMTA